MDIQSGKSIGSPLVDVQNKSLETKVNNIESPDSTNTESVNDTSGATSSETIKVSQTYDKASGVLQTILSDQLSDKVIKKLPPDEYLQLLSLVDRMMTGSIDNKV